MLEQLNNQIYQIDDLIFKMDTGQIPATIEDRESLADAAERLLRVFAQGCSENGNVSFQTAHKDITKVRRLKFLAAACERSEGLKPSSPEDSQRFVSIINNPDEQEMGNLLSKELAHIFVTLPKRPSLPKKKNVFQRFLSK